IVRRFTTARNHARPRLIVTWAPTEARSRPWTQHDAHEVVAGWSRSGRIDGAGSRSNRAICSRPSLHDPLGRYVRTRSPVMAGSTRLPFWFWKKVSTTVHSDDPGF